MTGVPATSLASRSTIRSWPSDPALCSRTESDTLRPPASIVTPFGSNLYSRAVTGRACPALRATVLPPPPPPPPQPARATAVRTRQAVPVLRMPPDNMRRHVEAPARALVLPRPARRRHDGLRRGGQGPEDGPRRPPRSDRLQAALQRLPHARRGRRAG